jgi:hypothetical protein
MEQPTHRPSWDESVGDAVRGMAYGALLSFPLWALLGWGIYSLVN